ncbi:MAG TPA: ABC transporter ATP-binding protein [Drouetiella sp.]|jgi:ABC-type lipoprotein export system ATPase subunit
MILKAQNLVKRFSGNQQIEAVSNVSLELERGQFLAVVGRSGSGKSTLLGMLGGISRPSSGSVIIGSQDQWTLTDSEHSLFRNRTIGFVFQFASLLPTLRAIDNVALPALIGGTLSYQDAYKRAHNLLAHVGLGDRHDSFPGQLSGGEQRRVAIARALINSPCLILADEPTADLDQDTEEEILNLLIDIQRAFNLTMVVVTHSNSIAERADQILRMNRGQVESIEVVSEMKLAAPVMSSALKKVMLKELAESNVSSGNGNLTSNLLPDPSYSASGKSGGSKTPGDDTEEESGSEQALASARRKAEKIFDTSDTSSDEAIRLGEGAERLIGRLVLWVIPVVLIVWVLNFGIAFYEKCDLEAKENQRIELEDLAMRTLRADVKDVTVGPGKSYIVTIYLNNTENGKPMYVMAPAVRGFVQVGTNWLEVPMKPIDSSMPKVLKIVGDQQYKYSIEPDVPNFTQLLPFYMHVRISNDMIVSPTEQPKTELVERNDNYYIYLKPHDAVDSEILKKLKFPGNPPIWIPMPPH